MSADPTATPGPDDLATVLVAEGPWLRRLALSLAGDPESADDLVQDTLLQALRKRPPGTALRAWLARVARNAAIAGHRRETRRNVREARVADPSRVEVESAEATAERLEIHRRLLAAVMALPEPSRTTVVLRHLEELDVATVAARTGVPVRTAETRLRRARQQLRADLDAAYGNQPRAWIAPLLAVAGSRVLDWPGGAAAAAAPAGVPVAAAGSASLLAAGLGGIGLKAVFSGVVVLLVVCVAVLWPEDTAPSGPPPAADSGAVATARRAAADDAVPPVRTGGRVAAAPISEASDPTGERVSESPPAAVARLVAVDLSGRPVPQLGARVLEVREQIGRSLDPAGLPRGGEELIAGPDGLLEHEWVDGSRLVLADVDPRFAPVIAVSLSARRLREGETAGAPAPLIVAPPRPVTGRVVDQDGLPLVDVPVRFVLPATVGNAIGHVLVAASRVEPRTRSGADGTFRFPVCADVPGAMLRADLAGARTARRELEAGAQIGVELRIDRSRPERQSVPGIVLSAGGVPVAGAVVVGGATRETTDSAGRFTVPIEQLDKAERLLAAKPGHQPGVLHRGAGRGPAAWPAELQIVLGGTPLEIHGTVQDGHGRPVAGALVWLDDPEHLTVQGGWPFRVEAHLAGDRALWRVATADAAGRFEMIGLQDRDYGLLAADPVTMRMLDMPVRARAGARDVTLDLSVRPVRALFGRLVARDGTPLPGAKILLRRESMRITGANGATFVEELKAPATTTTDEDGRFQFERLSHSAEITLEPILRGVMTAEFTVPPAGVIGSLEAEPWDVVVDRRCTVHIDVGASASAADRVQFRDAEGQIVEAIQREVGATLRTTAVVLQGGRATVTVAESAVVAVFTRDGEELRRVPLRLDPAETTTLR